MKQRLSFISILTVLLCMAGTKAFAHDLETLSANNVIIYYNYINDSTELEVTYRDGSIYNSDYSGSVVIPESVTIPDKTLKVTSISNNAFYGCSGLTSITIPNSVTSIGERAFYGCSELASVTIPSNVTSINYETFSGCNGLTSVTIPSSVTSIDSYAFQNCIGLKKVIVRSLAAWCSISFGDNPLYYAKHLYIDEDTEITDLVIPDGMTSISNYAFHGCSGLTSLTIPEGVTSIGNNAFYGCKSLISVTIPSSLKNIGGLAFEECDGLKKVIMKDLVAWCSISFDSNPLYYAKHLYSDEYTEITDLVIPDNITNISDNAFSGCSGLTSITIPSSVTSIGNGTFSECTGLTSVTLPNSVTNIGNEAFYFCTRLTSINIPNSVTSIGDGTFGECRSLTSINIPNSITSIGEDAFYFCRSLTSITIPSSVTSIGEGAFIYCTGLEKVIVEDLAAWCGISFGDVYSNPLCTAEHLYSDEDTEITDLVIPDGVTSIGNYAFYYCKSLTSITIPSSVTSIGREAFFDCSGLTSLTIPNSVASIESLTFYGCSSLTSLTIPNSVTSIGFWAFGGCNNLTTIVSLIEEPFKIGEEFSRNTYDNGTLYVPQGTIEKYKATEGWNSFSRIEEGMPSAISLPRSEGINATEVQHYTLDGQRATEPQRGLNIVKMSNGTTKKFIVK